MKRPPIARPPCWRGSRVTCTVTAPSKPHFVCWKAAWHDRRLVPGLPRRPHAGGMVAAVGGLPPTGLVDGLLHFSSARSPGPCGSATQAAVRRTRRSQGLGLAPVPGRHGGGGPAAATGATTRPPDALSLAS